jgi:hypothetical protein
MDNAHRMRDLIVVAGRLITLINEETRLLESLEAGRIGELQEEKGRLTRAYVASVRDLGREPDLIAAVDKAVRDELSEVLERFTEAAQANERALSATRAANERVMRAIIDAAAAQQQTVAGYSRAGTLPPPARTGAGGRPLSLSVDQRF